MRRSPLRILASAGSETRICTRMSSPTVAGRRRGAALPPPPLLPGLPTPLEEAEERSPSAFFILLAAAEGRERWSDAEEAEDADEAGEAAAADDDACGM
uniref:Uncharacterized protein n=1 Tax=Arundo donax TaxID=35708 RepID=A0A0A9D0G3_ARUDO